MLLEVLYKSRNGRCLLTDCHIYTIYRLASLVEALLVDDGVDSNGGLTGLTVADDKLALTTSDRNHRVDRLQTCLQRFLHRLAIDHTRSLAVERHLERVGKVDSALAVDGLTKRVDDTTEHIVVHVDRRDTLRTLHHHALLDTVGRTEKHTTYVVLLQVHDDSHCAVLEFEKLVGFSVAQTVDTRYAVAHFEHSAHLVELVAVVKALKLLEEHL